MTIEKKVFIPIEISNESADYLSALKELDFLGQGEVHFIHLFQTMTYAFGIAESPLSFPTEVDRQGIEKAGVELMKTIGEKILPLNFKGKVEYRMRFSDDPKRCFVQLVKDEGPDLIIVPCRAKHGLFESSFSDFVGKHTSCNLLLLKRS